MGRLAVAPAASMASLIAMCNEPPSCSAPGGAADAPAGPGAVSLLALADQGLRGAVGLVEQRWTFAFLSVSTASTTASSEWYTLCVDAAGSGTSVWPKMPVGERLHLARAAR